MKALLPDSLLNALFTISNYANAVGEQYAAIQASQLKATWIPRQYSHSRINRRKESRQHIEQLSI